VSNFRSGYTWKLFEICRSYMSLGRFTRTVEAFEAEMDAPPSCRGNFFNLQKRVIKPAMDELHRKSNLLIQCNRRKVGQKVTELEFVFLPNPQGRLDLDDSDQVPPVPNNSPAE
jgi:plasmid replication initiation protein